MTRGRRGPASPSALSSHASRITSQPLSRASRKRPILSKSASGGLSQWTSPGHPPAASERHAEKVPAAAGQRQAFEIPDCRFPIADFGTAAPPLSSPALTTSPRALPAGSSTANRSSATASRLSRASFSPAGQCGGHVMTTGALPALRVRSYAGTGALAPRWPLGGNPKVDQLWSFQPRGRRGPVASRSPPKLSPRLLDTENLLTSAQLRQRDRTIVIVTEACHPTVIPSGARRSRRVPTEACHPIVIPSGARRLRRAKPRNLSGERTDVRVALPSPQLPPLKDASPGSA